MGINVKKINWNRERIYMNYQKLISNRKSVREFKNKGIEAKYFNEIESYINNSKKLLP